MTEEIFTVSLSGRIATAVQTTLHARARGARAIKKRLVAVAGTEWSDATTSTHGVTSGIALGMETGLPPPESLHLADNAVQSWQRFRKHVELYLRTTEHTSLTSKELKAAIFLHIAAQEAVDVFKTWKSSSPQSQTKLRCTSQGI